MGGARLLLPVLLILAGCGRTGPAAAPAGPPAPFQASFEARFFSPQGGVRIRGLLAAGPGGRLRAEIAGPTVATPFLLVAGEEGLSAVLPSEQIAWRGGSEEPFLLEIAGVDLPLTSIARLTEESEEILLPGCSVSRSRWTGVSGDRRRVPGRIEIRCGESGLKLRIKKPMRLASGGARDPFSPLDPPPGFRRVDLAHLGRSIRESAAAPR